MEREKEKSLFIGRIEKEMEIRAFLRTEETLDVDEICGNLSIEGKLRGFTTTEAKTSMGAIEDELLTEVK